MPKTTVARATCLTSIALLQACQPETAPEHRSLLAAESEIASVQQALSQPLPALGFTTHTVLGQADANQAALNRVVPSAGFNVAGVHIRRNSPTDVKIFVADGGNNRVLAFNGYQPQGTNAGRVLGQPSGTDHMAPNGEIAVRRAPTAATLAFFNQPILSPTEEAIGIHLDTDAAGNLYVPDPGNNRVLRYNNPFTDATPGVADDVWGQPGFTTLSTGSGPAQMHLESKFWVKTVGLDVDGQGNLWVADPGNRRVMLFRKVGSTIEKTASVCLGQTSCDGGGSLDIMGLPVSVQVSDDGGTVWVLDGNQEGDDIGPSRIVKFLRDTDGSYYWDTTWVSPPLAHARGLTIDGDFLWIADTDTQRFLKLDTTDPAAEPQWFNVLLPGGSVTSFPGGVNRVQLFMGLGSIGIDTGSILFAWHIRGAGIGSEHYFPGLVRLSKQLPASNEVPVTSLHLNHGENSPHPGALASLHGMILAGTQLVQSDLGRLKVYNTPQTASGLTAPDFTLAVGDPGPRRLMSVAGGKLFVSAGTAVQIYQLPITSSSQQPLRVLESGVDITWANGGTVQFDGVSLGAGVAYDAGGDVLWLADNARFRVLRVRNPLGAAVVDLVLGQTSKNAVTKNGGLPDGADGRRVFGAVFSLALDNFGNLYVTDGSFEGGGNRRVMRFDAGKLVPPANNAIFYNPALAADAVFGKRTWQVAPSGGESFWPNHPVSVAFDRDNHMYLLADGYGDSTLGGQNQVGVSSFERVFFYERPHLGTDTLVPDKVIRAPFGQAAFASFVDGSPDRVFVQDHTWQRIVQLGIQGVPNTLSPFLQDAGATGLVSIEAEHHTTRKLQGGHDWTPATPAGFSGEGAVAATPNSGANVTSGITTGSPRLDFKIRFVKTGTHYLWVRGYGPSSSDNFVHAGIDGQVPATADSIGPFTSGGGWRGTDSAGVRVTVQVAAAGEHTVSLWMQKDGFIADKILLTTSSAFVPTGSEPESPRPPVITLAAAADAHVRDGSSSGTNFGTSATLEQKLSTVAGNHRRTFVRFGLAGVSGTVSAARLRLRGNSVTSAKLVGVYGVADVTWGETSINFGNAPMIGGKIGSSQSVGTTAAWIEWDVGGYVAAQKAAGATAVSFELRQDTANNETPTSFSAREAASNRPELVVTTGP